MKKLFYRIGIDTEEGLWYTKKGEFTGLIHRDFKQLKASSLEIPFDTELVGYLSVADSLEHLYQWFTREEIIALQALTSLYMNMKLLTTNFTNHINTTLLMRRLQ